MHRLLILLLLLASLPAVAQQDDADASEAVEAGASSRADATEAADKVDDKVDDEIDEDIDDEEIDPDELYAEDEDVFIPSEDVKFGQSIPFPTDI